MAYVLAQTGLASALDDRPAAATGALGMLVVGAFSLLMLAAPSAPEPDEGVDELPFTPAFVLALGSPEADAIMEQPSVDAPTEPEPEDEPDEAEPEPEDAVTENAVTEEPTPAPPKPRPPKPQPPKPNPPKPTPPKPPKPPKPGPPKPPSVTSLGDPFGTPTGWDDLNDSGDPWARGILAALNGMDVGTAYGKPITGNVRFEITVCKDGRISRVSKKGGSATANDRDLVLLEVGRLRVPRPPPSLAAKMKGSCAKLRHTFSWTVRKTQ